MEYSFPLFVDGRCNLQREIFTNLRSGMYVEWQKQIQEIQFPRSLILYIYMIEEYFWTILDPDEEDFIGNSHKVIKVYNVGLLGGLNSFNKFLSSRNPAEWGLQ